MILDDLLLLSDAQAFSTDAVSTNTVDLGNPTVLRQVGTGIPVGIILTVDVAADATTGNETYQFNVLEDDDAALGSPTIISEHVLLAADLVAGASFFLPIRPGKPILRYVGLGFDGGGTTPTITVSARIGRQADYAGLPVAYARGYTYDVS
jgi:hypothetical protein